MLFATAIATGQAGSAAVVVAAVAARFGRTWMAAAAVAAGFVEAGQRARLAAAGSVVGSAVAGRTIPQYSAVALAVQRVPR